MEFWEDRHAFRPSPQVYLPLPTVLANECFGNVKLSRNLHCVSMQQKWAGQRLGLPESGPGSLANFPRRLGALLIDWGIGYLLAKAFLDGNNSAMLLIFAVQQWLMVATTGSSIGHRLLGMRVVRLDGAWIGFWRSAIRVALILLVIPATIWDADNRGLHDKAAGTVLVRR